MQSFLKNKNLPCFPLLSASKNDILTVVEIRGGQHFKEKCINMGIFPGQKIVVMGNSGNGPCVVKANNARLMIDYGMLNRIFVQKK